MKVIKILICIAIIIFCAQFSYSKYTTTITGEGTIKSGDAIIVLDEVKKISNNGELTTNNKKVDYIFSVKNFDTNTTSDISYKYTINIKGLDDLEGVTYKLYNSDNGNQINRVSDGKYQGYESFSKGKQLVHNYKLEIECDNNSLLKSVERNVKISCDAEQI